MPMTGNLPRPCHPPPGRAGAQGKKMSDGRPWTEDDIRRLKLLAGEGISAQSIAKSLKRTIPSVMRKAETLKLTLARRPKAKGK